MTPPRIVGLFYAPPPLEGDARIPAVVAALERALAGIRLEFVVTPAMAPLRLPDRDAFLHAAALRRELPLIFNGDEARYVMARGAEMPGVLAPGGAPLWEVHVSLPIGEGPSRLDEAIGAVGRACAAFWGVSSPDQAAAIIATQIVHPHISRQPPLGLPGLKLPARRDDPLVPQRLGWINFWSAATAARLGFPDDSRDADLLPRSREVAGAWTVRLTDDPLDLGRPDHVAALQKMYERFPAIGGRG
jgi:hypothetical protein